MGLGRAASSATTCCFRRRRSARGAGGADPFKASLEEPALPVDPTSGQKAEQLPTYNAYSIDGDVTAPLVYVNYGRPEDYEELERRGISVKGAIVIARYGAVVARHQAEGGGRARRGRLPDLLGSARRRVFRRATCSRRADAQQGRCAARQRDGHAALSGRSADARLRRDSRSATRLDCQDATTLTKIPVLPISYGDAQPLLAR